MSSTQYFDDLYSITIRCKGGKEVVIRVEEFETAVLRIENLVDERIVMGRKAMVGTGYRRIQLRVKSDLDHWPEDR